MAEAVSLGGIGKTITIIVNSEANLKGLLAAKRELKNFERQGLDTVQANKTVDKSLKDMGVNVKKLNAGFVRFRMGLLSVMFFSMLLQRTLSRLMRSFVSTFKRLTESTDYWNTALGQLEIAWTFLQFSIGRAISDVLEPFIPTILGLVEAIVDFVEQHPEEVVWGLFAALVALTSAMILSQLGLLINGLQSLGIVMPDLVAIGRKIQTALNAGWGKWVVTAMVVVAISAWAIKILKEPDTSWLERIGFLISSALGGALIGAMFGPGGAVIGLLIGIGVGLVVNIIDLVIEDKIGIGDVLKSLASTLGFGALAEAAGLIIPAIIKTDSSEAEQSIEKTKEKVGELTTEVDTSETQWVNSFTTMALMNENAQTNVEKVTTYLKETTIPVIDNTTAALLGMGAAWWDIASAIQTASSNLNAYLSRRSEAGGLLGGFQHGGIVPVTGPYLLHAGEYVVPSTSMSSGGYSSTTNVGGITMNLRSNVSNERLLAREVSDVLLSKMRRYGSEVTKFKK